VSMPLGSQLSRARFSRSVSRVERADPVWRHRTDNAWHRANTLVRGNVSMDLDVAVRHHSKALVDICRPERAAGVGAGDLLGDRLRRLLTRWDPHLDVVLVEDAGLPLIAYLESECHVWRSPQTWPLERAAELPSFWTSQPQVRLLKPEALNFPPPVL
jgi:hypothetical protein